MVSKRCNRRGCTFLVIAAQKNNTLFDNMLGERKHAEY